MNEFSLNEVQFLTNLMIDIAHGHIELEQVGTEYDWSRLNYQSIADNLITKLQHVEDSKKKQIKKAGK